MDFTLNEQEKMIQSMARDFAQRSVKPVAIEIDRKCEFPFELAKEMGSMGYFGLPYPPHYGGVGAGYTGCLLYTSPSPRDRQRSRMPSSA